MRKFLRSSIALCLLPWVIIGCTNSTNEVAFVRDDNRDYKTSYSIPPLKVPSGVNQLPPDPYYVIPQVSEQSVSDVTLVPPGSSLMKQMQS